MFQSCRKFLGLLIHCFMLITFMVSMIFISFGIPFNISADNAGSFVTIEPAYAAINIGDETTIEGWEPSDIVSTDLNVSTNPQEASQTLQDVVIRIVKIIMPFLMIGCVAIIVFNAIGNIFRKPDKRVKMGPLIKNMLIQFFFIVFAWLIVEAIVFIVTGGETILFSAILGR